MSKHTLGPWTHYDDAEVGALHPNHKIQSRGKSIATVYCTRGDEVIDAANARLIAAAPDLLATLKALYERAIRELADPEDVPELTHAIKAIAKATGEA